MGRVSDEAIERDRKSSLARYHANRGDNQKKQKAHRERRQEERPFVGWDGEGYRLFAVDSNGECEMLHRYMLFGSSTGDCVFGQRLTTEECLELIIKVGDANPDAFHVGFSFEYDVNMILTDCKWTTLSILKAFNHCRYVGPSGKRYRIEHVPHKWFKVSHDGVSVRIFDTFGFFHCGYLSALKKYDVGSESKLDHIESGKAKRSQFTFLDMAEVKSYWLDEISLLPPLMDKIRDACYRGGYRISEWHGPGALASYLLRSAGVNKWHSRKLSAEVKRAIRTAYAGGRFQLWQCGLYFGDIYTADLNSAYVYACSLLPRMDRGAWARQTRDDIDRQKLARFGLYHISFDVGRKESSKYRAAGIPEPPYPLFHRSKGGILRWPRATEGWYYTPEAELVANHPGTEFLEAWVFNDDETHPFRFVFDAFNRRLELQRQNDPAEKPYKWGLAAMYGAFAQRVGWNKAKRLPPPSHELAWAGYITSWCRAAVEVAALDVTLTDPRGLVSIDTDGITSTVPFNESKLPNGVGENLGQWKIEKFSGILAWQNGIYWLRNMDGSWTEPKSRGIPKGAIPIEAAFEALATAQFDVRPFVQPAISVVRTRFIGYRQALAGQLGKWQRWITEPVKVQFGGTPGGKGSHFHVFCRACRKKDDSIMHTVTHFPPDERESRPHRLPWLEDQPRLSDDILNANFNLIVRDEDIA